MREEHFRRDFRLSRSTFDRVAKLLAGDPSFAHADYDWDSRSIISVERKLGIFLFRVSYGEAMSYRRLSQQFAVGEGSVRNALYKCMMALSTGPIAKQYLSDL